MKNVLEKLENDVIASMEKLLSFVFKNLEKLQRFW